MHKNRFEVITKLFFRVVFLLVVCLVYLQITQAQISQQQNKDDLPFDSPKKPINCETAYSYINDALIRYDKNKNGHFIVITRLGNGETSRQLNLNRIKTIKSYISKLKSPIMTVFAEGESIKGYGTIEIYVEGKLLYSLPLEKGKGLDLRTCLTA